jgi:3-oxoacyl-[acyl-carrier-protein] synthase III
VDESVLKIIAYGAWNGGTIVDNSIYENKGLSFKGGVPVTSKSIEERMGVRTRKVAGTDERIGVTALQDLLGNSDIDPSRIKLVIGATNVGDDKYDHGPLIRFPYELLREHCPNAHVMDLYAGCPGFNVAVELNFMLSLTGVLNTGDITIIVGAENIHRAQSFPPDNTANIIFGDDAMATALMTGVSQTPVGQYNNDQKRKFNPQKDHVAAIAEAIYDLNGDEKFDGLIIDNQLGELIWRVPATAARVQHALVQLMYADHTAKGAFNRFKGALEFYDRKVRAFAFDIMTLDPKPEWVEAIAKAYVQSGKYNNIISVFLAPDSSGTVTLHQGSNFIFERPSTGIIDTLSRTHGCFAEYIQVVPVDDDIFGDMDGKGVFLYATRGAKAHLSELFSPGGISLDQIDLLIEHQANFAMIPLTLAQVLELPKDEIKPAVADLVANKLITNIHARGNCSVVCMQRLPYDLKCGALQEDTLQGFRINANLDQLKKARLILNDSVGAGMTRSSFLQIWDKSIFTTA